ncbi:hypothetical protein Pan241w_20290 [Gimesia alba]|uniref:Uncharacterized protein n=1 Tax=Gimesia alba TaxID=2527973 RepID=A0A517RDK2_9PLAN|nr:hypothetical protein [Gimesia alba]QDT41949.1 hypothetical protein Pan241w_20290 [Gimesia alba]
MKKFLGLLLNCMAVCLCSAIGIGAGMYWIQTTQQHPATAPTIQQVGSSHTRQLEQAPNLIRVPAAPASQASPIPTSVAPQTRVLQQVAAINSQPTVSPNETSVSLLVDNKTVGTINKDGTGGTAPIFYLTPEELKSISFLFTKGSDIGATDITQPAATGIQGSLVFATSSANPVTATYSIPPQTFVNGDLTIVVSLPTSSTASDTFTFQIKNYPIIKSVEVKSPKTSSTVTSITDGGEYFLPGPTANLSVLISGTQIDCKLELFRKTGTTEESLLSVNKPAADFGNPVTHEIKQTGEYVLKLFEQDKPAPYETFEFKIKNIIQNQPQYPEIGIVTDSGDGDPSMLAIDYSEPNSNVNGTPCYLLRSSNLILNITKSKDRTAVFESQKIDSIPATANQFESNIKAVKDEVSSTAETYTLSGLEHGIYQFRFKDSWVSEPGKGQSKTITVMIPRPAAINPLKPALTSYKNQKYAEPKTNFQNTLNVFNGYLVLSGTNASPDRALKFMLFNQSGGKLLPATPQQLKVDYQPGQNGAWQATLKINKDGAIVDESLYILRQEGDQFSFSNAVKIQLQNSTLTENSGTIQLSAFKIGSDEKSPVAISTTEPFFLNTNSPIFQSTSGGSQNIQYVLFSKGSNSPIGFGDFENMKTAKFLAPLPDGQYKLYIKFAQGDQLSSSQSETFTLNIQKGGLEVVDVQPPNFGTAPGVVKLKIKFSSKNPLEGDDKDPFSSVDLKKIFHLIPSKGTGNFLSGETLNITKGVYQSYDNAVILSFENIPADIYQLVITGSELKDIFGNKLEGNDKQPGTNFVRVLNKPGSDSASASRTAVPAVPTTEFVEYHEYEKRDLPADGFNPSDKVVTRVARLYYYRDAHRVAQILNSEVQSLNHKGYQEAQLQADQARESYEAAVLNRRLQEEKAIRASKELRQKENEYRNQQQILSGLVRERANPDIDDATKNQLESAITDAQRVMNDLRGDISTLSSEMNTEDDELKKLDLKEDQLSAALFRSELRAEKTDLYTIGNGDPESYDAVRQVTIKVIGEGLIHLRGPIKGVNIIRTMINQIDSPVGQVRIAMHTIQVNGEDAKRMENVADRIQKSIDQSRFLTVQSAQMLRKAIVAVASEVAISTCQDGFAMTQEQRDEKYLYAFFGRDFIEALQEMDSEFLQSGNKLLSIHSMDTTSLSSALFVLALAKNDIRQQILARFYASIETDLPNAECQFLYQGGITKANKHPHKMNLLAPYANFQSFRGFFDHEVIGTDTMTPIQREFVRLAQIFKAKLTTERELNLHVMERAMIEQRVGNYLEELKAAKAKEDLEEQALAEVQKSVQDSQIKVIQTTARLQARVSQISNEYAAVTQKFDSFQRVFEQVVNEVLRAFAVNKTIDINSLSEAEKAQLIKTLFPIDPEEGQNIYTPFDQRLWVVLVNFFPEIIQNSQSLNNLSSNISPLIKSSKNIQITNSMIQESLSSVRQNLNTLKNKEGYELYKKVILKQKGKFKYGNKVFNFRFENFSSNNSNKVALMITGQPNFDDLDKITKAYVNDARQAIKKLYWYNQTEAMQKKLDQAQHYLNEIESKEMDSMRDIHRIARAYYLIKDVSEHTADTARHFVEELQDVNQKLGKAGTDSAGIQTAYSNWRTVNSQVFQYLKSGNPIYEEAIELFQTVDKSFNELFEAGLKLKFAEQNAKNSRLSLDHKKFLDMQIDQTEDKFIELVEGTRAHTANIDNYLKRIATALEDDFNTQFYYPAFKEARDASRYWNVSFGSMETSSILTNNRSLGKVAPKATIEFDLPKRQLAIVEGMNIAEAAFKEYGALVNDPTFLAITSMNGGENVQGGYTIKPDSLDKQVLGQPGSQGQRFGSAFENLIPDPAVFKFETGTGFTVRPVIQPDGQAVVFDLNYLYRTNVREPVRADEKHLGRIKEHFIDTDVQLGNYELREISRFVIALKASRTANGVPLLSDVPGVGVLFRPTPSAESSLQQSQIMSQAVIYPTLFDLMGLRWAPAVADVGPLELSNREFISKGRDRFLKNRVYDYAGSQVDQFLQIKEPERRSDLYRTQETIPDVHPNGYMGPGLNLKRSHLQENFHPEQQNPSERFIPRSNRDGFRDTDRAVPVLPSGPGLNSLPPIPSAAPAETSAMPVRDNQIQPASWTATDLSPKREPTIVSPQQEARISSPRRVVSQSVTRSAPTAATPKVPANNYPVQQKAAPSQPKQTSIYKRSVSRIKSLFRN